MVKGVLLVTGAVLCLVVGFAGIFLPVIPGIPLMLFGLHLLGVRMPFLTRWIERVRGERPVPNAPKEDK